MPKFEKFCEDCDLETEHVITSRKSKCSGCGRSSHHFAARVHESGFASPIYAGADDPAGTFPEVDVSEFSFKDGQEVAISWCCLTAKDKR